jgi:hypothetical protein
VRFLLAAASSPAASPVRRLIPQGQDRPRRRYYHLTGPGEVASDEARKEFPGKLGLGSSMKNDVLKRKDNAITCREGG